MKTSKILFYVIIISTLVLGACVPVENPPETKPTEVPTEPTAEGCEAWRSHGRQRRGDIIDPRQTRKQSSSSPRLAMALRWRSTRHCAMKTAT